LYTIGKILSVEIKENTVFIKGTFRKHADLFDRFSQNASDYLLTKIEKARALLTACEEEITWPLITGPGFSAATHPGAESILINTIFEARLHVYNSDCLYINPGKKIFAVSDPPGITVSSRTLFRKLDRLLSKPSPDSLKQIINRISENTPYRDNATLSLIHIPDTARQTSSPHAVVYVAGDTLLFHGNLHRKTLTRIEGNPQFFGTTHAYFEPVHIPVEPGDLFVIASDGIRSLLSHYPEEDLESILLRHLTIELPEFVSSLVARSNAHYVQHVNGTGTTRLGGNDNVTILAVLPEGLSDANGSGTYILGGYGTE
jgi:hypothetical protein